MVSTVSPLVVPQDNNLWRRQGQHGWRRGNVRSSDFPCLHMLHVSCMLFILLYCIHSRTLVQVATVAC